MIATSVLIQAPISAVWLAISDLATHDQWMADAESIEFATPQRQGVGTRLLVATRVGPLRTLDMLEVVEWVEGERITVVHEGTVSGRGSFELTPQPVGTGLTWREELRFPWWMGGVVTATLARPVLSRTWRANLVRFTGLVEGLVQGGDYPPTA